MNGRAEIMTHDKIMELVKQLSDSELNTFILLMEYMQVGFEKHAKAKKAGSIQTRLDNAIRKADWDQVNVYLYKWAEKTNPDISLPKRTGGLGTTAA